MHIQKHNVPIFSLGDLTKRELTLIYRGLQQERKRIWPDGIYPEGSLITKMITDIGNTLDAS